jgi:hypothetical protein
MFVMIVGINFNQIGEIVMGVARPQPMRPLNIKPILRL